MLPAASGTKIIAWRRTVALSFFSSASKIALFQRLSWYWKMSCPITSAIRQAVISQATFQLFSEDQKPRAVRQNRRTSGLACSRSICFLPDFFFLAMKTVVPRRLTVAASTNAAKFQKFTCAAAGRLGLRQADTIPWHNAVAPRSNGAATHRQSNFPPQRIDDVPGGPSDTVSSGSQTTGWTRIPIASVEDLSDAVLGAGLVAIQMSVPTPVTGSLAFAAFGPDMTCTSGYIGGRVALTGPLSANMVTLGVGIVMAPGTRHGGHEVPSGSVGVFMPGDEHDALYLLGSLYAS